MHDRRIEGQTYTFGNHGALWMNAMTWYDHETGSIWSQPWGRALVGPLKGTQLRVLPFSLVPYETWLHEHPGTLVLYSGGGFNSYGRQMARDDFVAGVAIGDAARAYPFPELSRAVVVNDDLGGVPLVIHANPETRSIHIYVRQLSDGTLLIFSGDAERLVDEQTGSVWDPARGLAVEGALTGAGLREMPYVSAYDWAWLDFYPESDFYRAE